MRIIEIQRDDLVIYECVVATGGKFDDIDTTIKPYAIYDTPGG
jgi:hypothetical protein